MSNDKPKTVVPPARGRGGPHPAEVNEHLGLAYQLCNRLIEAAEHRGDQKGADAWLVARNAIEAAEKTMSAMRELQTWRSVQGERVGTLAARARADSDPLGRTAEREAERRKQDAGRPPYNVECPTCGAPIGYPCQFSPVNLHVPNEIVHVARSNAISIDGKPRCTAWAYPHHPSWEPDLQKPGGQRCVLGVDHPGNHRVADPGALVRDAQVLVVGVCDQGTPGCTGHGDKHACIEVRR